MHVCLITPYSQNRAIKNSKTGKVSTSVENFRRLIGHNGNPPKALSSWVWSVNKKMHTKGIHVGAVGKEAVYLSVYNK